jgi:hypothetical protein
LAWDQWSQYLAPWRVSGGTGMPSYVLSYMLRLQDLVSAVLLGQEHLSGLHACLPC